MYPTIPHIVVCLKNVVSVYVCIAIGCKITKKSDNPQRVAQLFFTQNKALLPNAFSDCSKLVPPIASIHYVNPPD
jgi:hypothetical protein